MEGRWGEERVDVGSCRRGRGEQRQRCKGMVDGEGQMVEAREEESES